MLDNTRYNAHIGSCVRQCRGVRVTVKKKLNLDEMVSERLMLTLCTTFGNNVVLLPWTAFLIKCVHGQATLSLLICSLIFSLLQQNPNYNSNHRFNWLPCFNSVMATQTEEAYGKVSSRAKCHLSMRSTNAITWVLHLRIWAVGWGVMMFSDGF